MTLRACVLVAVVVSGAALLPRAVDSPVADLRSQAEQDFKAGNFRDAWELYRKLALDPQDDERRVGSDLTASVTCLQRLSREDEVDAFRDAVVGAHQKYWRLLQAAADSLVRGNPYGFLIGGQFIRGNQRGGGESVTSLERDRVRALQLMQQAIPLVQNEPDHAAVGAFYVELANQILVGRDGGEAWKLQVLTDLSKLPDYEPGGRFRFRRFRGEVTSGAPVDADGNPIFYHLPARYESAKSDGERWRWALARAAEISPAHKNVVSREFADFLRSQFGVQTLLSFGPLDDSDADEPSGPFALSTLKDDETIARLATGIKRFGLPDEFNFIRIYRDIAASGRNIPADRSLTSLAEIYESRRQYPRAAEVWREYIRRFGPGDHKWRTKRLEQIVGNWGRFESTPTQPAAAGRTIGFRFRNGTRVDLEAHEIRIEKLLADVKAYLKSNPKEVTWQRTDISNIGYRLIDENQLEYLGRRVAQWTETLKPRAKHFDRRMELATPLQKAGAYLVTAKMAGGNTSHIVLWIADTVLVHKPLAHRATYFIADAVSGKPIAGANVEFFGWQFKSQLGGLITTVETTDFAEFSDENGQVIRQLKNSPDNYQWIVMARTNEGRLAFSGFESNWWTGQQDYNQNKAFVITDRPVYRPGQPVKFKFWARNARYEAAANSPFAGQKFKIRITNPQGETALEKTYTADAYGGFDGTFALPPEAALGQYYLRIIDNNAIHGGAAFRVEEYKKPEFEVQVEAPKDPVRLGDKATASIKANYYLGGPVTQAHVHYKVTRNTHTARWYPLATWDWLFGPGYWWFWPDSTWYPGWAEWGCLRPVGIAGMVGSFGGPPEIVLDATVPIGPDGTVKITIDTALAKAVHGNLDQRYDITAEVVDQSRRTITGTGQILVAKKPFQVIVSTDRGYYHVGDPISAAFEARRLDQKPVKGHGSATLYRVTYAADGKPAESVAQTWKLDTDERGDAQLRLKASQAGQYRLSYRLTDAKQQTIEGAVLLTVVGEGFDSAQFRFNDLELIADKREYAPGEKVRLLVNTNRLDSTVVLYVKASSTADAKPQVLRLKGRSMLVEIGVAQRDMPNFFVEALTVSGGRVYYETREIVVPPERRILNVAVQPSAHDYKPGAKAGVKLKVTDLAGKPVVGSVVLAVYDKSVEYISGGTNIPEIRKFFWNWRNQAGPRCDSSLDRESNNLVKNGENSMFDIGMSGQFAGRHGYYGPGTIVGMSSPGDGKFGSGRVFRNYLELDQKSQDEAPVAAMSNRAPLAEKSSGKQQNEEAAVQPTVRSQFADTAFWAARLESNRDGLIDVSFPMPENLSTWKIRSWALSAATRVGQGDAEIVTTKNLLLRMQAPRFFVETDEVVLSANVHNHLKTAKSVRVELQLEGKSLTPMGETSRTVQIAAGGEARVDWRVQAVEHGEAVVRMQALTDEESDAMQMHFPVRIHGMLKTESYAGAIRPDRESASFQITVPSKRRVADTLLEIRYSPTLAGAMVDALPYLVSYPHKTTDCTLYRFLPTVITQNILKRMHLDLAEIKKKRTNLNAQELGDPAKRATGWKRFDDNPVFDNGEVTRLVKDGLRALTDMQLSDGAWGWFSGWGEYADPHMTAQVVHGLQLAQRNGVAIVPGVLEKGVAWLKAYQSQQIALLKKGAQANPIEPYKTHADNIDSLVYGVLVDADVNDKEMQDFLYHDRTGLSVYAQGLFGLALSQVKAADRLAMVVRNIDQFLNQDDENQTAWLKLPAGSFWWFWYDNETEANAYYLKLLSRTDPKAEKTSRLAKYLLNNRKHATYWNSPRDTAIAIEALAEYFVASGEDRPQMTVEVYVDGKKRKEVAIDAQNLFTFDNKATLAGAALEAGVHKVELRKRGKGPLYFNGYLTNFTLEDFITHAGLEIKVERNYFKLVRDDATTNVSGSRGQVVGERTEHYRRVALTNFGEVKSGDLLEIELTIDSKNDYEHLIFEDPKAAGVEPFDVQSGYNASGLPAYVELRDEKVTLFLRTLPRGKHSLRYRMRAEIPGKFSALPTLGSAMYAPELGGNSDEMKLTIGE